MGAPWVCTKLKFIKSSLKSGISRCLNAIVLEDNVRRENKLEAKICSELGEKRGLQCEVFHRAAMERETKSSSNLSFK